MVFHPKYTNEMINALCFVTYYRIVALVTFFYYREEKVIEAAIYIIYKGSFAITTLVLIFIPFFGW